MLDDKQRLSQELAGRPPAGSAGGKSIDSHTLAQIEQYIKSAEAERDHLKLEVKLLQGVSPWDVTEP